MRMRRVMWPGGRGLSKTTYLESVTPIYLFTITLLWGYNDDCGEFTWEHPHRKAVLGRKFCAVKIGPHNGSFRELRCVNVIFCFLTRKGQRHILAWNRVVWRITRENRFRGLGSRPFEEPGRKESKHFWCAISRIRGKETCRGIVTKFCTSVDIHVLVTYATFLWRSVKGFGRGQGSNFPFPHWHVSSLLQHSHYRASVWSQVMCRCWLQGRTSLT